MESHQSKSPLATLPPPSQTIPSGAGPFSRSRRRDRDRLGESLSEAAAASLVGLDGSGSTTQACPTRWTPKQQLQVGAARAWPQPWIHPPQPPSNPFSLGARPPLPSDPGPPQPFTPIHTGAQRHALRAPPAERWPTRCPNLPAARQWLAEVDAGGRRRAWTNRALAWPFWGHSGTPGGLESIDSGPINRKKICACALIAQRGLVGSIATFLPARAAHACACTLLTPRRPAAAARPTQPIDRRSIQSTHPTIQHDRQGPSFSTRRKDAAEKRPAVPQLPGRGQRLHPGRARAPADRPGA